MVQPNFLVNSSERIHFFGHSPAPPLRPFGMWGIVFLHCTVPFSQLNRVGMWQVREKREYDEDTVLRSMEEARLHDARRQGYVQPTSGQVRRALRVE